MKNRSIYIIFSLLSLLAGGLIYLLFSENTILEVLLIRTGLSVNAEFFSQMQGGFLRNHFCDFLWAFSLGCALWAIYLPKGSSSFWIYGSVFGCGTLWEIAQYCKIVSGTGDLLDILMYLLAAATIPLLSMKRGKRK